MPDVLDRILAGDDVGTLIAPGEWHGARWRHIAVSGRKQGALVVNQGALQALLLGKASLLPVGVVAVEGSFDKGELVEIRDGSGRVHGRGLVNYDADACRKLAGRHSDEIDTVLGTAATMRSSRATIWSWARYEDAGSQVRIKS